MQPKAVTNNAQSEEESLLPAAEASQELPKEDLETVTSEQVASDGNEKPENRSVQEQEESRGEIQEPSVEVLREGEVLIVDQQPGSESQVLSQKMEVPNDKVNMLSNFY